MVFRYVLVQYLSKNKIFKSYYCVYIYTIVVVFFTRPPFLWRGVRAKIYNHKRDGRKKCNSNYITLSGHTPSPPDPALLLGQRTRPQTARRQGQLGGGG